MDIFNSTSNMLIYSKCGLTKTLFQYPTPDDSICHSYKFTVTPVNVVGNGTSSTVSYFGTETSKLIVHFNEFYLAGLKRGEAACTHPSHTLPNRYVVLIFLAPRQIAYRYSSVAEQL